MPPIIYHFELMRKCSNNTITSADVLYSKIFVRKLIISQTKHKRKEKCKKEKTILCQMCSLFFLSILLLLFTMERKRNEKVKCFGCLVPLLISRLLFVYDYYLL